MARRGSWYSHGINKWRKREIMAWCRQYDDWKKELQYGLRAVSMEGGSRGNSISRPTENQAIRNERLLENIQIIDRAIREVCPEIEAEMLNNIARGIPYSYLQVPYSQADFYAIRIDVYSLISARRKT